MIALHSPEGVVETEVLGCPPENMAAKLAIGNDWDAFSGPVRERVSRNSAHFPQIPEPSEQISLN
jgi:hypothetical protein